MSTTIDPARVEAFAGLLVHEAGAALNTALAAVGDRLGLYRAMADGEPVTPDDLAARTGTHARYVAEWLACQAASGFVTLDADTERYSLPAEHAAVLADDASPVALAGLVQAVVAAASAHEAVADRFRTGAGLGWHEHHHDLFHGTERAFGATYRRELLTDWLPSVDGLVPALEAGIRVADVGCGHGAPTILMAAAFPASSFTGYDSHPASIEAARAAAAAAGVADRVRFRVAAAAEHPAARLGLVCFLDTLHDMGDRVAAARRARAALDPDGVCLVVEPAAGDRVADNLHAVGRLYYGMSTLVCTPGSLSQPGRAGLGTQAGAGRITAVLREAGFATVEEVVRTPFNIVLAARP